MGLESFLKQQEKVLLNVRMGVAFLRPKKYLSNLGGVCSSRANWLIAFLIQINLSFKAWTKLRYINDRCIWLNLKMKKKNISR